MASIINRLTNLLTALRNRVLAHPADPPREPGPGVRPARGSKLRVVSGVCHAISTGLHLNRTAVRFLALCGLVLAPPVALLAYLVLMVLLPFERPRRRNALRALPRTELPQEPLPTILVDRRNRTPRA
jgi:phage shock protein PspC (stress-responsive transcriptional regulator)